MWFRRIFRLANQVERSQPAQPKATHRVGGYRLSPGATRQLDRLQIRGSEALRGDRIGGRASNRRKPEIEFREYRTYVPGDDIRFVDWRASARNENVFIRQGEMKKDVIVYLLLDTSASMAWGEDPKRRSQLAVASALGYSALSNGDRLYVYPYGQESNTEFGPVSGKGMLSSYARYLNQVRYGGRSNLVQALRTLTQRVTRGGVVFILSDLLEKGTLSDLLTAVPAPKWWVNVLHFLHPEEISPLLRGTYELEDSETGRLINFDISQEAVRNYNKRIEAWRQQLEMDAVSRHAFYLLINTSWDLETEILPLFRERKILEVR
jgi:uncharacterized protein (DUF58 family)